jgi:hypothetical protein
MADESDNVTLTIESADGTDEVTLSQDLLQMLAEGDETPAEVVGDLAMFGCAQRAHMTVHHNDGEVDPELEQIEATTMDLFEQRFGATYGEVTGHQH